MGGIMFVRHHRRGALLAALLSAMSPTGFADTTEAKARVAVQPVVFGANINQREQGELDRIRLAERFRTALNATRTFLLFSRDGDELRNAVVQEKQLAASSVSEAPAEDFQLKIATYLVQPKVTRYYALASYEPDPDVPGLFYHADRGELEVHIAVLDHHGQVVYEDLASARYHERQDGFGKRQATAPLHSRATGMVDRVVQELVAGMTFRFNPVVGWFLDGELVIDRGGPSGLSAGQLLAVYSPPRTVTNPVTGEERRIGGRRLGKARITGVFPGGESRAAVIEGTLTDGEAYVLRKQ